MTVHTLDKTRHRATDAGFRVPAPTRLGHIPRWFTRHLKIGYPIDPEANGFRVSWREEYDANGFQIIAASRLFDHWGSSVDLHGRRIVVSEVYNLGLEALADLAEFARRCRLRVNVEPIAYHNTGQCIRIEFSEPNTTAD